MDLQRNTFLVAGGSSGLGAACTRRFVERGAHVAIADLDATAGAALVNELGPDNVLFVQTDVTSANSVAAALERVRDQFQTLHGVINCAGILGASRIVTRDGPHDLDLFTRVVQVNLIGTFNVLRLAAVMMSENAPNLQGERGVIINTASIAAAEGQIGQAAYSASKGGVAAMTLPIARELAGLGIRVVAIAPGVFLTPMMQNAPPRVLEALHAQTVFPNRLGQPDEFAAFAQQIVENPMLNGCVLRLDGAMRMSAR